MFGLVLRVYYTGTEHPSGTAFDFATVLLCFHSKEEYEKQPKGLVQYCTRMETDFVFHFFAVNR